MERKLIAAAVSSALVVPMSAQAVEFAVSGHVNRAVIVVDQDGYQVNGIDKDGDLQHVDANSSGSRFRMTGSEELDSGMTAGVNLEMGVLTGSDSGTTTRHANVYLDTAGGRLTLGHTSDAADGMAHARLGGPSWLGGVTNWCAYHSAGPACPSNDGTRREMLKYDTPALGPARLSFSTGDDERWDTQLRVAGSMGDAGYDFRIGYIGEWDAPVAAVPSSSTTYTAADFRTEYGVEAGASTDEITAAVNRRHPGRFFWWRSHRQATGGPVRGYTVSFEETPATTRRSGDILTTSAAVSFGQGTAIAAAWSRDDMPSNPTQEHEYFYAEIDQSYGDGSVGVYWKQGETSDSAAGRPNTEGTLWGIGWGHNIGGGATAYAGFRHMEEDRREDINLYIAGMRVTFN